MRQLSSRAIAPVLFVLGLLLGSTFTGVAFAYQGHMWTAHNQLQSAVNQLNMAVPDKDGHRVNAINLANEAIEQVNLGIQAGAR